MIKRRLQIEGPAAEGTVVNATALRDLLNVVIEGSQRAVRLRVQGRSSPTGPVPDWIVAASDYKVEVKKGSTVLEVSAPTLIEADPEQFRQTVLFSDLNPELTALDYLTDTLEATHAQTERSDTYDRPLLRALRKDLAPIFARGVSKIRFLDAPLVPSRVVEVDDDFLRQLAKVEKRIPPSQRIRLAGKLDAIRHSDRTFVLITDDGHKIKGAVPPELVGQIQELWGNPALLLGTAHFTASGQLQLIEADVISAATEREARLWGELPTPLESAEVVAGALKQQQGPRSGLNAILGRWPGDEDDAEILEQLEKLS